MQGIEQFRPATASEPLRVKTIVEPAGREIRAANSKPAGILFRIVLPVPGC
ncbi:MAG: hypothetical protein WBD67_03420 [Terracidiphilus sp.]